MSWDEFVDVSLVLELEGTDRRLTVTFTDYQGEMTELLKKHRLIGVEWLSEKRSKETVVTQRWRR